MSTIPKHEPELRLAKGRAYAARCNEIAAGLTARRSSKRSNCRSRLMRFINCRTPAGLSNLKEFPPNRFEWTCEKRGTAVSVKLRDKQSGAIVNWPHWAG
jgi:hypothetical protein